MRLNGLSSREVERSRKEYGLNHLTKMPQESFVQRLGNIFKNPLILVTVLALIIQTVMFFLGHSSWILSVITLTAIMIVGIVSAVAHGKNQRNAESAFYEDKTRQSAKVVRDGNMTEVQFHQVVVGDMVLLQAGDKIPADGEIAYGKIVVDQTSLDGSADAEKVPAPERVKHYDTDDLTNRYYVHRGSVVISGEAYMYVKAVGDKTLFGKRARQNRDFNANHLPKIRLGKLWTRKAFLGYALAVCILLVEMIFSLTSVQWDIYTVLLSVSELLSVLTVTSFCMTKGKNILTEGYVYDRLQRLSQKNIDVKDIHTLMKMEKIKVLLADRTGIFTDGNFSVNELAVGDGNIITALSEIPEKLLTEICIGIGMNNSANANELNVVGGDRTDRALLSYLKSADVMGVVVRQSAVKFTGYDVEKKYAGVVSGNITYIKGEAKTILNMCRSCLDVNGQEQPLDPQKILAYISKQAEQGNRVIAAAKLNHQLYTLICIVSLKDSVRSETAEFVKNRRVQIVMLTSDSKECAKATAESIGLLENGEDILTISEISEETLPKLKVVAELQPKDKLKIVAYFKKQNINTAVLADSVYDVKPLEAADVSIVPQSGSEAAKQTADMILLDDNIVSLKKIIK